METFFPDDSPLRYWLCNATIAQISCSASWPPIIAVAGYAPCVRAWSPTSRDEPQFKPVQQLLETDGERFTSVAVRGELLVAAEAGASGRICVWDTTTWTRQQTLTAGAPVTSLDACRAYIAAGTSAGYVRVWRRHRALDATFLQFFTPDLQLDCLPVECVRLACGLGPAKAGGGGGSNGSGAGGGGGGGSEGDGVMMVVHTRGNGRVSVWRLSDAKILGTLCRPPSRDPSDSLLAANVTHTCLAAGTLLTLSWLPGREPLLQWIHPLQRAGGEVPGVSSHLAGLARPLALDYDGYMIVMGCEDGMVWVWGALHGPPSQPQASQSSSQAQAPELSHWRGYHQGAVGAVACLPARGQVASAGADGCVKLWAAPDGALVAAVRLGWQVTSLAVNELALVAGGAEGQLQLLVLLPQGTEGAGAGGAPRASGYRLTEGDRREATTPPVLEGLVPYNYWFDARGKGGGGGGAYGRAAEYPDAFAAFVPPRRELTLADLQQQQQPSTQPQEENAVAAGGRGAAAGSSDGGSTSTATGSSPGKQGAVAGAATSNGGPVATVGEAAGSEAPGSEADAAAELDCGRASTFNMQAALKGAQRSATDQAGALAAEEAAKRAQLRAMGEGPGVARSRGAVTLEGGVTGLGRKCGNPSCLQREGLMALQQGTGRSGGFKRCGACKSAFYCSTHCQSTHWRDGHKKECAALAEAWRRQQQQLLDEQLVQQQSQPQSDELQPHSPEVAGASSVLREAPSPALTIQPSPVHGGSGCGAVDAATASANLEHDAMVAHARLASQGAGAGRDENAASGVIPDQRGDLGQDGSGWSGLGAGRVETSGKGAADLGQEGIARTWTGIGMRLDEGDGDVGSGWRGRLAADCLDELD